MTLAADAPSNGRFPVAMVDLLGTSDIVDGADV